VDLPFPVNAFELIDNTLAVVVDDNTAVKLYRREKKDTEWLFEAELTELEHPSIKIIPSV